MRWFTADTHFGHKNIIRLAHRPFSTVDEMDEAMIRRWNMVVNKDDEVWHLGDFCFGKRSRQEDILARLHGEKHLIFGNHDSHKRVASGWVTSHEIKEIKGADGTKIVLFHFPMDVWNHSHVGAIHLHGHSHGTLVTRRSNRFDVGVDAGNHFFPVGEEGLFETLCDAHDLRFPDHHGPNTGV